MSLLSTTLQKIWKTHGFIAKRDPETNLVPVEQAGAEGKALRARNLLQKTLTSVVIWLSWTVSAEKYRMNGQLIVIHPKALHDIYVAQAFSSLWAWDWAGERQSNTSIGNTFRPPKATAICICISNSSNWRKNMENFRRMATFTGHHSWRCSQGVLPKGGKPGRAQHHLERGQNASLQGFPTNSTFQLAPCSPSVAIAVAAAWAAPAGNCLPWPKGPPASGRYGFCWWDSTFGPQYRYTTLLLLELIHVHQHPVNKNMLLLRLPDW